MKLLILLCALALGLGLWACGSVGDDPNNAEKTDYRVEKLLPDAGEISTTDPNLIHVPSEEHGRMECICISMPLHCACWNELGFAGYFPAPMCCRPDWN